MGLGRGHVLLHFAGGGGGQGPLAAPHGCWSVQGGTGQTCTRQPPAPQGCLAGGGGSFPGPVPHCGEPGYPRPTVPGLALPEGAALVLPAPAVIYTTDVPSGAGLSPAPPQA